MFLFNRTPSISGKDLEKKLAETLTIIDVREKAEFSGGHIPGAVNVPLGKISGYKPKTDPPIYVICQSGIRSKRAVKNLEKRKIQAVHVKGGMIRWQGAVKGGNY
ncbi:rhodanese-like domain-containing protein [Enterococcus sp. BWB1-3]|uniref:rhodanese-like domain-containing protein n=1 Tax=unclassified Enterococcus TaxID=2608891 RepID=UPI001923CDDA|nr:MULTISPECIES: rhodanese-like domain-containing protein [unclassified Enterococcus]MBL1229055.1 rhodanese-like domain-containing protein [Enterococcus sp. BWB1-3]MCB5953088.1 rhodanese-like domain-containing protein [Enterococcus sp. BWT-B8]